MKKYILSILLSWLIPATLLATGQPSKLEEANVKYKAEDYAAAAVLYEEILKEGKESASVYYNLGNAYYKQKELGRAILNYERALLRDPNNEDIKHNLGLAKSQTVDNIKPKEQLFLMKWIDSAGNMQSSNAWARISIISFIIVLSLGGLFVFSRTGWMKKSAFFTAILFLLVCAAAFYFSKRQKEALTTHNYAIIISGTVTVKSSPDESGKELFLLHEGTKVKIKQALTGWDEIQLEDGSVGWVIATDLEKI
jgi:tetratricopeptide (TPR) repeat protein